MGVFVEAAEEGLVVDDVPEAVLDFLESDVFVVERLAQEVLAGVEAEGAGAADVPDLEVAGVLRRGDPFRVGSGRAWPVDRVRAGRGRPGELDQGGRARRCA